VVVRRHQQHSIYEEIGRNLLPDYEEIMWEKWMVEVDRVLEDEELVDIVEEALKKRNPDSRRRGRPSTPAEVVLRMMILKHMRNWSYEILVREVRSNLVYRQFTRVGAERVPDDKTMVKLGQALGPEVVKEIHGRIVAKAKQGKVVKGRKMRVDTTVIETNIHYPTDSTLLGDGVRVITRVVGRIEKKLGEAGTKTRNRMKSVQHRMIEIGKAAAQRGEKAHEKRKAIYRKLMRTTRRVMTETAAAIDNARKQIKKDSDRRKRVVIEKLIKEAQDMIELTERVLKQTRARVIRGKTHYEQKLVSVFETGTEVIRKGKAAKPTEFGKMVKIQEAENQIITDYEVYEIRPADQELLIPSIEEHKKIFGRVPELVAADGGFHSNANMEKAAEAGVKKLAVPGRRGRSKGKKKKRKERWYTEGLRWRVGCEGRISVLKRRSGLARSRYKGINGMKRWVGFGVIADNLISMGQYLSSG
jgi:IS5 family transposase